MFKEEGQYHCKITRVQIIEGRFDNAPDRQEVEITVSDGQESGQWHGSLAGDYIQSGNNAGKMEIQRTLEIINEIAPIGSDLTRLEELLGKEVEASAKKNKNGYMVIYLGGRTAKPVDPRAAMAKMNALLAQQNQFVGQAQQQPGMFGTQQQPGQMFGGASQLQAGQFGQFPQPGGMFGQGQFPNQQGQFPQQNQQFGAPGNGNPFAGNTGHSR
jgi:hypothetical protein